MTEVILILLLADLAVVRIGSSFFDVIQVLSIIVIKVTLKVPLNSFSKLEPLESLVLQVILLSYRSVHTLSTGSTKAGVKKSLSALKVGTIMSPFEPDLHVSELTSRLLDTPVL